MLRIRMFFALAVCTVLITAFWSGLSGGETRKSQSNDCCLSQGCPPGCSETCPPNCDVACCCTQPTCPPGCSEACPPCCSEACPPCCSDGCPSCCSGLGCCQDKSCPLDCKEDDSSTCLSKICEATCVI